VYSIATIFDAAIELFEGDVLAVRNWMISPVRGLDGKAPMKMLGTRVESRAVLDLIGRLEHGVIA
jgi:putative toxin-antitoxin system antitoxin component (TIGR02293 family)